MAVDDEPDLCALTKEFLEMAEDMEVDTASSVREAMGVLAKKHYDAIVSDYQMPKEDGIQFLKSLRQKENMIPFILFTGKGREEIVIEALNNGADSYLQKGGTPKPMYTELEHRIRTTVRRYEADKAVELKKMELQRANKELSTANIEISLQAEELRMTNLALERSRDKYMDLYDFAPIGYMTLNDKAVIVEVNLTGASQFKIVLSKLVKSRFSNFIAEKDFNQWYRYFKNVLDQEEKQTCTLTLRRGDGSEFPARLESIQIPDNINGGRMVRMAISDVTDNGKLEETLREKEAKYRDYVENSPIGVFICDEKGRYLDVNSAATTITGYTREELLELSIPDILPPESLELVSRLFKLVSETGRTTAEFAFRRKDGSIGTWSLEGVRLSPTRLMGLTTDITERKRVENALRVSEERFSGLVDQSPLSIQILEPSGKTVQVNRAFEKLWGVSFEQMRDYNILEDEQFEDLNIRSYLKKAFSGDPVDYPPVKFTLKAGSVVGHERLVQAIAYPIRDGSGAVREVTLIHQDITELKHAENALREANRKLNLLSSITRHDINNQLMALSGNLTLLERKYPDIAGDKTLHMIEVAAERISAMIRFTKEYEDIGTHHSQWQDVRELVSNASNGIALGQVHLVNDIPSGAEIFADPLIQKVFYNLMDNSVRHGGRITTVSISVEGSGDDHLIVCEDDGDGVIEGEKEIIFNRCFGKNTGLGLALSREILAITGITIRENGEPNKGARFEMSVPKGGYRIKTAG